MARRIESPREVLARNVRMRRAALRLSQEALATRAGLHRTYVGAIERAERNVGIDMVFALADALQCEPGELLKVDW